jgi:hypothetical protein
MKFRTYVEPLEPMRGLEISPEVVEALGGGKRQAVTITINGHSWKSRVAIMRGRYCSASAPPTGKPPAS